MRYVTVAAAAIVVAMAAALGGCAGLGDIETATLAGAPIPPDKARMTVLRGSDLKNGATTANVAVNGVMIANLSPGGSVSFDIPVGPNRISVSTWSQLGQFAANLNATVGANYAVEVFTPDRNAPPGPPLGPLALSLGASLAESSGVLHLRFIEPAQVHDAVAKVPVAKNRS